MEIKFTNYLEPDYKIVRTAEIRMGIGFGTIGQQIGTLERHDDGFDAVTYVVKIDGFAPQSGIKSWATALELAKVIAKDFEVKQDFVRRAKKIEKAVRELIADSDSPAAAFQIVSETVEALKKEL